MVDPNDFFVIESEENTPLIDREKIKKKVDKPIESVNFDPTKPVEKIITWRKVDKEGNVSIAWSDKSTIHPLALPNFDKYKDFY